MRTINDAVHGHLALTPIQEALLQEPEVQRLTWISQLGMTRLVFPGATNTRLEHSLGVSYLAGEIADHLQLNETEKNILQAAGLLHDLGHPPFSHVLESLMKRGHEEFTAEMVTGKSKMPIPNAGNIPKVLKDFGIKPKDVADLITKKSSGYMQQIISSEIDADRMDYLVRDAHYTGTTYGMIDVERTIKTMALHDNELVFLEKGLSSVEDFLIARNHMYSSVYIHHTVEIADKMLLRASESVVKKIPDFYSYTDGMMLSKLSELGDYSRDMIERITYRNLFKRAFVIGSLGAGSEAIEKVMNLVDVGEEKIEEKLCQKTGIRKGYVIADIPLHYTKLDTKLKQTGVNLLMRDGRVSSAYHVSGIARALSKKEETYSLFSVYSRKEDVEKVGKAAERMLK